MSYFEAKQKYENLGVDVQEAIDTLKSVPISLHCWQGDDVRGFDQKVDSLSGGIQTTGNYPGRARTPEELMSDLDVVLKLCPGTKKLNLHACYAIFDDENGGWLIEIKLSLSTLRSGQIFARREASAVTLTLHSFLTLSVTH